MNDTIAAISTALGVGAISIIRVSGNEAINIVNKIFDKNLEAVKSHTINYGHICDGKEIIDEVLVSVMKSPSTFTTEDIVEINCHGGINTTNRVLTLVLANGARMAEPGEFSKRAFLNGRIDLVEAEGIMDLIGAKTDKMRKLALNQVDGKVSELIINLRKKIRDILINIEVNIDYPEYEDILVVTKDMINCHMISIKEEIEKILKASENAKVIKEGIKTVIVGRPNVGKSSILNCLLKEEKAIVTDIPGTTRDTIEGMVNINGIMLNIIDTAGIRETDDIIEKIGVDRSIRAIEEAELVILVLNNNEEICQEDLDILKQSEDKKKIILINKSDLESKININALNNEQVVYGNTISNNGLDDLKKNIIDMFNIDKIEQTDFTYLSNARQIGFLKEALSLVTNVEEELNKQTPVDILQIDIQKIWELLGQIIGENCNSELIDELFKQFCLGK